MAFKRFPDEEIFHVQRFDHFPRVFLKSLNLSKATHYLSTRYTTGQGRGSLVTALLNCGHRAEILAVSKSRRVIGL